MKSLLAAICGCLLAAAATTQVTYEQHLAKIDGAIKLGDTKTLDRAVKEQPDLVVRGYEVWIREKLFTRPDDPELKARLEAVKESWKRAFNTETLDKIEQFISTTDQRNLQQLDRAVMAMNSLYEQKNTVLQTRKKEDMRTMLSQALTFVKRIEETFNAYRAAEVWLVIWEVTKNLPEPTLEDRREAIFAMEQFKSFRDQWEFTKDMTYLQGINWLKENKAALEVAIKESEKRKDAGYKDEAKGADAFVMPNVAEVSVPLEFKALTSLQDDFFVRGGPVPGHWLSVAIKNHGPEKLPHFTLKDLFLRWDKGNNYLVSLNGSELDLKKAKAEPIHASNKLKPSLVRLNDDPRGPQYAFWFYLPGDQEPLYGFNNNLAPYQDKGTLNTTMMWKSASSWVATIGGETVTFYDDNCNGELFEEDPLKFGLKDRALGDPSGDGLPVPAFDSMRIGKGPLQPFSSYAQIAGKWYHLRGKEANTKVGVRPLNPEFFKTGTVQLKWTAPPNCKPEFIVLRPKGDFRAAAFDVASGKPVEVPAGDLELAYGRIEDGKFPTAVTAHVFLGELPPVKVEPGKTATLALGAPFKLEWQKEGGEAEAVIDSVKFRVLGAGGELYARLNGAPVAAEVMANKTADAKGAKVVGEFLPITDSDTLNKVANKSELRSEVAFFPVVKGEKEPTTKMKVPSPGKDVLLGVVPKKHRLFGVIAPVWK